MDLDKIKQAYCKALEARRKEITKELARIERQFLTLSPSETTKAPRAPKAALARGNPKNADIFPVLQGYLSKRGAAKAPELITVLNKAGYVFGGEHPDWVLQTRLQIDKEKTFSFDRQKGWTINNQAKPTKIHLGG